jgi:hypothetical protein
VSTTVTFELHRLVDDDVVELDEASLVDLELAPDEELVGVVAIEGGDQPRVAINDDLRSAVQRLCFEAVGALLTPNASVEYLYFTCAERARLDATGEDVTIRGSDVPEARHPRAELLVALYGSGLRYVAWVTRLGRADDLAQLTPHADQARDALRGAGLL